MFKSPHPDNNSISCNIFDHMALFTYGVIGNTSDSESFIPSSSLGRRALFLYPLLYSIIQECYVTTMQRKESVLRTMSKSNVIVLNASYEPLGVVPIHRAMLYIIKERAEVVKAFDGEVMRTSSGELPIPIAVRFTKMVKVPYRNREMQPTMRKVLLRDNYKCAYCGKHAKTVDHIHPKSRGGKNTWMNLIAACQSCNSKKADKTLQESNMKLLYQPRPVYQQEALLAAIAATGYNLDTLFI